jgi:electron transfer flavoprotein alpha subunit
MPKNSKGKDIAEIIPDKCIGCQMCVAECPVGVINMENGVAKIDSAGCIGCGKCKEVCPVEAVFFEKPLKKKPDQIKAEPKPADNYRGIAVFIEVQNGIGADVAWELIGKARELAGKLETKVFGFLLGAGVKPIATEAIAYGCDAVYMMEDIALRQYLPRVYGQALTDLCLYVKPEIFLLGATHLGRDLAGVVATRLGTGLTADCTGLDIDPATRLLLMMTRPTFGGNLMATILCRKHRPQMSTVRPRVMRMLEKDPHRRGEIQTIDFKPEVADLPQILDFIPKADESGMDITRAPVLVVLGKGACDSRNLPMLEELAGTLGGTLACSRPVVETGLLPYTRQVGQTGKTVAPKIYIGVGVSGAVQHLAGIQGSQKIIAINTDRHAPMVQIADYAIIGDYQEIVPELIKGFKTRIQMKKE